MIYQNIKTIYIMKKNILVLICSFIALGWMGCHTKGPLYGPGRYVYIDSTLTACGMDSFLIKSPWMQERINTCIDTARAYIYPPTELLFCHFIDKDSNDFFIRYIGGSGPGWLYDCEGNFIEKKTPWKQILDEREDIEFHSVVVNIIIGLHDM